MRDSPFFALLIAMVVNSASGGWPPEFAVKSGPPRRQSLVDQNSILRSQTPLGQQVSHRPTFAWRTRFDSSRQSVILVADDDSESGFAYIGLGTHSEPEVEPGELLPPEDDELPVESVVPKESLKGSPIPLDGAPRTSETSNDEDTKPGFTRSSFGWVAGTGNQLGMLEWVSRDLGVYNYDFTEDARFSIEPGFAMRWLTGPTVTDLPPYLFSIVIDSGFGFKVSDRWHFDGIVSPSWNTDFANKSYPLFRLPWQAVNTFTVDSEWKLVLGITDLDREDIHYLPVAGVIYKPIEETCQLDLVFPHPKAAWRLSQNGEGSRWGYVAGELGGGSFTILRPNAVQDIATLRDFRLLFGWEQRGNKRHSSRIEAGWVFGRAVEYASGIGDYSPSQTAILRISDDF